MMNHYYDADGVYTHSAPANRDSSPPRNALRIAPPPLPEADSENGVSYCNVLNPAADGWEMAEDHRGRMGYVDGKRVRIDKPGPLPAGWSEMLPPLHAGATDPEEAGSETTAAPDITHYYLTRSGTYHADGCAYTTAAGQWLSLSGIAAAKPMAKPCGRCNPPRLEE